MLWLFYRVVMTYRIILTQGNNLSVENNVLGLWNCITYNLKVTSKRAYVHKRLKGEPDQILLGKYYLELGKNTEYNRKRWWIYLHLCAFHLFLEYYSMFMFPIMKVIEKYVSYMSITKFDNNCILILNFTKLWDKFCIFDNSF